MNRRILTGFLVGITFGIAALLISWALLYETSPLYQDSLHPGWARFIWQVANIPALLATVLTGTAASAVIVGFIQWCVIGWVIFLMAERVRKRVLLRRFKI